MMIYLVEDDESIRELVIYTLKSQGFEAKGFERPSLFWKELEKEHPSLLLLDVMLPEEDGISILKKLRVSPDTRKLPIIMLTARGSEYDTVIGLDSGADDYLIKPFHIRELMARVRALTRRPQQIQEMGMLSYADLHFDYPNRKVTCNGQELILTAKETELLSVLMKQPETSFSREQLVLKVWGSNADIEPGNVDNYISFLRKRLRELHSKCAITTIYGSGYRLESAHA